MANDWAKKAIAIKSAKKPEKEMKPELEAKKAAVAEAKMGYEKSFAPTLAKIRKKK